MRILLAAAGAIYAIVFIALNRTRVRIHFVFFTVSSRLWVGLLVCLALGALLGHAGGVCGAAERRGGRPARAGGYAQPDLRAGRRRLLPGGRVAGGRAAGQRAAGWQATLARGCPAGDRRAACWRLAGSGRLAGADASLLETPPGRPQPPTSGGGPKLSTLRGSPPNTREAWTISCPNGPVHIQASRSGSRRPRGVDANRPAFMRAGDPDTRNPHPDTRNPHPPPPTRNHDTRHPQSPRTRPPTRHPGAPTRLASRQPNLSRSGSGQRPARETWGDRRPVLVHTSPPVCHRARRMDKFVPGSAR